MAYHGSCYSAIIFAERPRIRVWDARRKKSKGTINLARNHVTFCEIAAPKGDNERITRRRRERGELCFAATNGFSEFNAPPTHSAPPYLPKIISLYCRETRESTWQRENVTNTRELSQQSGKPANNNPATGSSVENERTGSDGDYKVEIAIANRTRVYVAWIKRLLYWDPKDWALEIMGAYR